MKYLLTIEYFGTNYSGWQWQKNAPSIQQTIEDKLAVVLQAEVKLCASGRTDAGVHAYGQKAHFTIDREIDINKTMWGVNTMLPYDIRVVDIKEVAPSFHAQYSAKKKTYIYKMYVSRFVSPIRHLTHVQVVPEVDFSLMLEGAELIKGTHDFKAFSSTGSGIKKTTVRTLSRLDLSRSGDEITMTVTGNGFLYNMVRIIAGTLVWLGKGKLTLDDIREALETGDRKKTGKTFPANGLYLYSVEYEDE